MSNIISEKIKKIIIFEDDDLLVLNKPAGLLVHAAASARGETTLVDQLLAYLPSIKKVGDDSSRPGLIHRLDRDTSGLIVVAKTQKAYLALKKSFKLRQVQKTYLALVFGVIAAKKKIIDMPIARSSKGYFIARHAADVAGLSKDLKKNYRWATTYITELERFLGYTLLAARPKTGRTHQIRVHLKALGHPIVGDQLYSGKKQREQALRDFNLQRQFLHAAKLSFKHPQNRRLVSFEAPLPDDLQKVLDQLHTQK